MNKATKLPFNGMNQDISKYKHPGQFYYEGKNIRIVSTDTQSTGSLTNEKGNKLIIELPSPTITNYNITYGTKNLSFSSDSDLQSQLTNGDISNTSGVQELISHVNIRNGFVLFSTDSNNFDCIWEVIFDDVDENVYELNLLYIRNLGFTKTRIIDVLFNYENENIQKIYWVDGFHQIRNLNIRHGNIEGNTALINVSVSNLNFVGNIEMSQPIVTDVQSGGIHTAGMVQYAYNLFNLNGSQTKISPLSPLQPLGKNGDTGGGDVNEVVSSTPVVKINDIDTTYDYIRIYAIKYTSYNQSPSISLIEERELNKDYITIYDDGSNIEELSLEEFIFLGSDPLVPQHIESKDNTLFMFNIKSKVFDIPEELDLRTYSFDSIGNCTIYNNVTVSNAGAIRGEYFTVNKNTYSVPLNNDAVNINYSVNKYQSDGITLGSEGKYLKMRVTQTSNPRDKYYKDNEIYRFGIILFNKYGQKSEPKWSCDYRMPKGNLEGNFNTVEFQLKPEFFTWLNTYQFDSDDNKPVGYRIVRAVRTQNDKTILAQGIAGSMMFNFASEEANMSLQDRIIKADNSVKRPNFILRSNVTIEPLQKFDHLQYMQFEDGDPNNIRNDDDTYNAMTELQHDSTQKSGLTFQYNAMYQLYSPEIIFNNITFRSGLKFQPVGFLNNTVNASWHQRRKVSDRRVTDEVKVSNTLSPHASNANYNEIVGSRGSITSRGLISNTNEGDNGKDVTLYSQYYREYLDYEDYTGNEYTVYGRPEITERGQGRTLYNSDSKFEYNNSLEGIITDGDDEYKVDQDPIVSVNSWGAKCATLVLGQGTAGAANRTKHDDIYSSFNKDGQMLYEIKMDRAQIYTSNIYGGNSYEDKQRTTYTETGDYSKLDTGYVSAGLGDTFIGEFQFTRINKTDTETYQYNINQLTEIIKVKLETSVDLSNRNDTSINAWDNDFQPQYVDYHKYNEVYSQQSNLITTTGESSTFRRINNFDTRIQATKTKIPNESIDSWTDILVNETMELDGKYGPINGVVNFKDNIFTLQDRAVALVNINPNVQVAGQDGITLELGKGDKLYDFKYISTDSGTLNKQSIISTPSTFYYYDTLNRAICRFNNNIEGITDTKGLHTYFINNVNTNIIKKDNPLLKTGVSAGYDLTNNEMYMTFLQDESFTLAFNEMVQMFTAFYDYKPSMYLSHGNKFITSHPDINKLYKQYDGEYNNFYGQVYPSSITLMVNPESDLDCVFNNIEYKSEFYINDIDQPKSTLTSIQAWNEYQDSGKIPLVYNKNIRRKFRDWRAQIPRNSNSRDRIRNPYIFLKLELDNANNGKFILHDIIIHYTV